MSNKKIIVIDDSQTIRQQVRLALGPAGYEIVEADDGLRGAAAIRKNPEALLAICDVNMPHLGGLEMLDLLRGDKAALDFPVLMLTTDGRPDIIERGKLAGVKGWIVKPFKPTLLLAAVNKIAGSRAA